MRRSRKQTLAEARCRARILWRTLHGNDHVEHYPNCGAEHREFWAS